MSTTTAKTYCRICPSACGAVVELDGERVVSLRGDRDHPLTGGYTCSKGRGLPAFHHSPDRLLAPHVRRDGRLVPATWDEALDDLCAKLETIIAESGPESVGIFLGSGCYMDSLCYWITRRIPRVLGTPQNYSDITIDTIPKLVASEMVCGTSVAITRPDHERCRFLLYLGTNPVVSHGQMAMLVNPTKTLRGITDRGELWVVDPRRTETAMKATRHLAAAPGSDHALLAYLIRELLIDGADHEYIAAHTQDVDRLAAAVAPFDLATAARTTRLPETDLSDLLAAIRRAGRISVESGTGLSMAPSGTVVHWLGLALMAVTGSLDREGGCWFNPGFHTQADQRNLPSAPPEGFRQPGPASRPELSGFVGEYPSVALADEIEAGNLRALLNLSANLVTCMPETERTVAALAKLDVLATLEVAENATTALSSHLFPVKGQLERIDTPLGTDLMYPSVATSFTDPVVSPLGEARSAWWVLAQIGKRLGYDFAQGHDPDTTSDEALMAHVIARSPAPIGTLQAAGYAEAAPDSFGWFQQRVDRMGGWRLAPEPLVEQLGALRVEADTLVMISRRMPRMFNSRIDTARHAPLVHLNPEDAGRAGLAEGARATVRSPHGEVTATVLIDATLSPGVINFPHGFTDANANRLTSLSRVDPISGMAYFSGLPVTVEAA